METSHVAQVRSFNRTVTERVGALNDHFLGRGHPLGQARLLWEIGPDGAEIRDVRRKLALDSAYISRLLRALEREGLIVVEASPHDRRVRHARLTAAGRREYTELERRAEEFAHSLLTPLTERQQDRLAAAMAEVERLLLASMVTIAPADPHSAEAQWCLEQYFAELNTRFDAGFDPAQSISAQADELLPPSGVFLIATLRQEPIGCGALKLHNDAPGEVKRMWVSPQVRGLGVGRRLLDELERYAKQAGASVLHLETNGALVEAIDMYRRAGYGEVPAFNTEPYAHHWFEKRL